jgi:hypothetical protein
LDRREKYRGKALQCLLAAEKLHDPAERIKVLQIAQSWMSLADHVSGQSNDGIAHGSSGTSPHDLRLNDG